MTALESPYGVMMDQSPRRIAGQGLRRDHADSFPSGRARIAAYVGCTELSAWQGTKRPVFARSVRRPRRLAEEAHSIGREQRFSAA
jgi:hypothetical protein